MTHENKKGTMFRAVSLDRRFTLKNNLTESELVEYWNNKIAGNVIVLNPVILDNNNKQYSAPQCGRDDRRLARLSKLIVINL